MTDWAQVAALALIQGMTEFLPVSSSAHLILPSQIWGWPDQGLLFDVSVHAGTLCAVLWYFRPTFGSFLTCVMPGSAADRSELWSLCIATIPVVIVGVVLKDLIAIEARAVVVITVTTLGFGVLMGLADRVSKRGAMRQGPVSYGHALLIGLAQVFALIPGTSRSGVTITAALFLGYHPAAATRFSFLLSVPVIGGALLVMLATVDAGETRLEAEAMLLAFVLSAVFAYATIKVFIYWLDKVGLMPFVVYRVLLGLLLWVWIT